MNNQEMFKQMLIMQDQINTIVNPDWRLTKYAWHRAVWIECAELITHHGYKWWKHQEPEWDQITLEVVDIWHFGMSMLLSLELTYDELAADLAVHYDAINQEPEPRKDFVDKVEVLAGTATTGIFDTITFFDVMLTIDIDLDLLYIMYIGKNVLNKFRQSHGYKQGTYQKTWYDGREDNEHLTDIMNSAVFKTIDPENQISHIFSELECMYNISAIVDTSCNDDVVHSNGC